MSKVTPLTSSSKQINMDKYPLKVKLMLHQKAMIYQMIMFEQQDTKFAIMSNEVGSGKTYSVLAYIYFMNIIAHPTKNHINLIVVPFNICSQWVQSMEIIFGIGNDALLKYRTLLDYGDMMAVFTNPQSLLDYDIILTTSLYYHSIAKSFNTMKVSVKRLFFDEADTIKNLLGVELKCNLTWFISASIHSLFGGRQTVEIGKYSLNIHDLKKYDVHCDPDFIAQSIVLPDYNTTVIKCSNKYFDLLLTLINSQYHPHLHAMDYKCIVSEYYPMMSKCNSELVACIYLQNECKNKEIIIKARIEELEQSRKKYLDKGMVDSATQCRQQIDKCNDILNTAQRQINIFDTFGFGNELKEPTGMNVCKLNRIMDICNKIYPATTIIYSEYDYIYTLLKPLMNNINYKYTELDGGNITAMDKIIYQFRSGMYKILLADSSMYSCGMNLEFVDNIIIVHRMATAKEEQLIGRAQRFGRVGILNIWYVDYA